MAEDEIVGGLRRTELFGRLDGDALRAVAAGAQRRTFPRGAIVFLQGDPGDALYAVVAGRVKISIESAEGDAMLLATLAPPDTFGELALIDGNPRSATAEAVENAELISISRQAFRAAYQRRPELAETLLEILGRLVRRVTGQAADLALLDLEGRIARLLVRLAADAGNGTDLDLGMTQSELASMVGGSRQSVNQILHDLQRAGFIAMSGRRLRVLRSDALRRRAGL